MFNVCVVCNESSQSSAEKKLDLSLQEFCIVGSSKKIGILL